MKKLYHLIKLTHWTVSLRGTLKHWGFFLSSSAFPLSPLPSPVSPVAVASVEEWLLTEAVLGFREALVSSVYRFPGEDELRGIQRLHGASTAVLSRILNLYRGSSQCHWMIQSNCGGLWIQPLMLGNQSWCNISDIWLHFRLALSDHVPFLWPIT